MAVNPSDKRYQKYIGKNVFIPLVNRPIPVIADEHADPEFGTGAVKITPAHDSNDFEVGLRHHLEKIIVINPDGTMNHYAEKYEGMDRFLCREKLVEDLQKQDFLLQVEPIIHSVGHSERTDAVIEPYLSKQWFVKMRPLADQVLENQKNKETKVNFVPTRYEKIMNHWMEITYDWCISRQLWWGHRIPAWYKGEEIYVGMEAPQEEGWRQDKDVLDTWFSSALWPFSTLGWPLNTEDFQRYYPTDCLVTGYDIIPFWVNRMTFQGLEFTGLRPFKDCLIHGLIRDKEGRKFSKSLGNGVDPMDMIELYGADALRYYLATVASNGTDIRFDEEKIKATWNFINKLWNASRFVLINALEKEVTPLEKLKKEDKWILTKLNKTIKDVTKFMNKYEFNNVGNILYDFIWTDFCDKYIELAKYTLNDPLTKTILVRVLATILKMLHPFMPYVTDEIYSRLCATEKNIAVSDYPIFEKTFIFEETAQEIEDMFEFIKIYRNIKAENKITNDFKIKWENASNYDLISKLLKIENQVTKEALSLPSYKVKSVLFEATIYYEKKWSNEEIEGLKKEIELIEKSIERRKKLLANTNYVEKAPQKLVEEERQKLQREEEKLKVLQMELK